MFAVYSLLSSHSHPHLAPISQINMFMHTTPLTHPVYFLPSRFFCHVTLSKPAN